MHRRRRATSSVAFALAGVIFVVPLYLQAVRGFDALGTGLRIIQMVAGPLVAGALADSLDRTSGAMGIVLTGLVVMGAGLLLLARVDQGTAYVWLTVGLAGCGFGIGTVMATSLAAAAVGAVGDGDAGVTAVRRTRAGRSGFGRWPAVTVRHLRGGGCGSERYTSESYSYL
ncbi:hypothetical protein ABZU25_06365 [Micromonospora sp. NPDC005215]|uniref:hypothetical protein n=1 Tax=Micromonospora sp. NPDC005215 TaxID=3157024 RepID=UPI0033BEE809